MKKNYFFVNVLLAISLISCKKGTDELLANGYEKTQTHFYFDAVNGDDSNSGDTPEKPLKSLLLLSKFHINPGDSIFLAKGVTHQGTIKLKSISATKEAPVVITSYGDGDNRAVIDAKGNLAAVYMEDCSNIEVMNLEITADGSGGISDKDARTEGMRCGILYKVNSAAAFENIKLNNIYVHHVFIEEKGYQRDPDEVNTANGEEQYGWGIRFINETGISLKNIEIENCVVENVSHTGIKFSGKKLNISDSSVSGCVVRNVGGPGIQMSGVQNVHVHHNVVDYSGYTGDESRNWGRGSGYWCWGSDRVLVEYNRFTNAYGPNDSAGAHIDYNCSNVIYQYNFSANNYGGFCEILGNNYNCCYRYNISVNDGKRSSPNIGATFFISGYTGAANIGPFNSYIYNNTIYTGSSNISRIAITKTADGLYIANNIFYISGSSIAYKQNQFSGPTSNAVMKNNLFLNETSWNSQNHVQDQDKHVGNPSFSNPGGLNIEDYIPSATEVVKDKGILLEKLPGDEIGLFLGLEVKEDILGNPIIGNPDFGAIEMQ